MNAPDAQAPLDALVRGEFVSRGDEVVARRVATLVGGAPGWPEALLALAVRAVRDGASALDLRDVAGTAAQVARGHEDDVDTGVPTVGDALDVPPAEALAALMADSPLVRDGVMHLDGPLVLLDRYYRDEVLIAELVASREELAVTPDASALQRARDAVADTQLDPTQRTAVDAVVTRPLTVLTGGPGMGKTYTLAAVIRATRAALGDDVRLALAAPTGKAAARMTQALRENGVGLDAAPDAVTLHRLLGSDRRNTQRFVHNRSNLLPHDLVIIDEASMLSLALTARLLEALRPDARLLLVGDADQLASVEAGSVLSDLVAGLDPASVVRLTQHHRLSESRRELALAFAADTVDQQVAGVLDVLAGSNTDVHHLAQDEVGLDDLPHVVESAWALREAARQGDADAALAALRHHRLLCAHRTGPYGVARWNRLVEGALSERGADVVPGRMYVGRPLIVTANDRALGLYNGDTGVVIERNGQMVVLMDRGQHIASHAGETPDRAAPHDASGNADAGPPLARTEFSPWHLADVETMHAMTVHKAQGSQAEHVTVIVPPVGSRLLTREMLYTALTRASAELTVVGTADAIEHAVRTPVRRASGLAGRLARRRAAAAGEARHETPPPASIDM